MNGWMEVKGETRDTDIFVHESCQWMCIHFCVCFLQRENKEGRCLNAK